MPKKSKAKQQKYSFFGSPKRNAGLLFLVLFALVAGFALMLRSFAAVNPNTIYLSPTNASVVKGSTLTVSVRINPDSQGVDSVTVLLNYDVTKLQFMNIDASTSAFSVDLSSAGGSGSVTINRGISPGFPPVYVTSDSLIADVTFTVLAGSGSSSLQLAAGTNATNSGEYTNPTLAGATLSFTGSKGKGSGNGGGKKPH